MKDTYAPTFDPLLSGQTPQQLRVRIASCLDLACSAARDGLIYGAVGFNANADLLELELEERFLAFAPPIASPPGRDPARRPAPLPAVPDDVSRVCGK